MCRHTRESGYPAPLSFSSQLETPLGILSAPHGVVNGRMSGRGTFLGFCGILGSEVLMAKRIAIATIGTQGDVQPYVALAIALRDRGYSVVLGAPNDFKEMIEANGLEFFSLGRNIQTFVKQSNLDEVVSKSLLTSAPKSKRVCRNTKIVSTNWLASLSGRMWRRS